MNAPDDGVRSYLFEKRGEEKPRRFSAAYSLLPSEPPASPASTGNGAAASRASASTAAFQRAVELGATVVAPANGNAIFAAVGLRLRYLPIRPAAVPEALGHA